jgi:peptide/nickel transport system permease protein
MTRFITRRIGLSVLMLVISSILIFIAMRVIPGDPTTAVHNLSVSLTADRQKAIRHELGIDRSIFAQYLTWIGHALRGDLGHSYFSGFSTTELIRRRLAATAELAFSALLLALLVAIPAGVVSAMRPRSLVDRGIAAFASVGIAMPGFWLGVMLASTFGVQLGWLPARGYVSIVDHPGQNIKFLILPAVTLAVLIAAPIIRYLRMSILEVLSADFIRTAEGKGIPWRQVVLRHALPNGMLPTLNVIGVIVGFTLAGVVYIEYVFGWPGLGALTVDIVLKRDYIVLQSLVLLAVVSFVVTTLVIDLLTLLLDPRLRREAVE